jgi:pimeloyl-ACP methyl ester carboxylesterase
VGPTADPRARTWLRLASRWLATAAREDVRQVPTLLSQYRKTGPRSMRRVLGQARHDRLDVTLAAARCPVLIVRGRHDRICPLDWAQALTPRVVSLPEGGHMVPLTNGDLTATEIARFLEDRQGDW